MNERYRTFTILAEERSFTQTAKRLFCSQPTVSQHIQQLENELQCKLILRKKHQIQLTPQGEIVLGYVQKMQNLEQTMQQELIQTTRKNVPLYISQYIAGYFFTELFPQDSSFGASNTYDVMSYCHSDLRRFLQENNAKFAIMPIYEGDKEVSKHFFIEPLFEEELVFVMSKHHPLAKRQVIYARDLKNNAIFLPQSRYLKEAIKEALTSKGISVNFTQMTNFELIKKAVQQQRGCAFLPRKVLETCEDQFVCKSIKGLVIKRKNGIVYNTQFSLNEEEQAFCEHVKHVLKKSTLL